ATGPTGATGSTGATGATGPIGGPAYVRTIVVSPVPGDPAASGKALAAVFPIAGASLSNPYLVHIEPGEYDIPAGHDLALQGGVDVEGSGEDVTTIVGG